MIVVLDDRPSVANGFVALFQREGVAACTMEVDDLPGWLSSLSGDDMATIEAVILGEAELRLEHCRLLKSRTGFVLIATMERPSLDVTLELFAAGIDDVVRKPIHARELMARIRATTRRAGAVTEVLPVGDIQLFSDGRDPIVAGEVLQLPRRERRILEFLASKTNCRVSKTQIFHAVYGLFNEELHENVIESHLSKLRKRLRERLGYDPIDSKRYLGYRLEITGRIERIETIYSDESFAQPGDAMVMVESRVFQET
jgi:DNA-binding response OmpR family regulator